jgi:hypothetical protein
LVSGVEAGSSIAVATIADTVGGAGFDPPETRWGKAAVLTMSAKRRDPNRNPRSYEVLADEVIEWQT